MTMPNVRVIPPNSNPITTTVNGRTYSTTAGTPLDVPDFDALALKANGWHISAMNGVGATTVRPANPTKGMRFADTTLGVEIAFDGKNWRNPITGAVV
jgi:hypothetical protein